MLCFPPPAFPPAAPDISPDMPPASDHDCRSAAPDAVPGSTNASSRNSTSGDVAPIATISAPTTALPTAAAVLSPLPLITPLDTCTPIPSTSADVGPISRLLMNHRKDFQNHALVDSASSPAAVIGEVATRISNAASRTNISST